MHFGCHSFLESEYVHISPFLLCFKISEVLILYLLLLFIRQGSVINNLTFDSRDMDHQENEGNRRYLVAYPPIPTNRFIKNESGLGEDDEFNSGEQVINS